MASISDTDYPDGVYPPSDDTFLLVDAVSADLRAKPSAKVSPTLRRLVLPESSSRDRPRSVSPSPDRNR